MSNTLKHLKALADSSKDDDNSAMVKLEGFYVQFAKSKHKTLNTYFSNKILDYYFSFIYDEYLRSVYDISAVAIQTGQLEPEIREWCNSIIETEVQRISFLFDEYISKGRGESFIKTHCRQEGIVDIATLHELVAHFLEYNLYVSGLYNELFYLKRILEYRLCNRCIDENNCVFFNEYNPKATADEIVVSYVKRGLCGISFYAFKDNVQERDNLELIDFWAVEETLDTIHKEFTKDIVCGWKVEKDGRNTRYIRV